MSPLEPFEQIFASRVLNLPWQTLTLISILCGSVLATFIMKKIVGLPSRTARLYLQYWFAAAIAVTASLAAGTFVFHRTSAIIFILGVLNAYGCYCQWRAIDIHLTKASVLIQLDFVVAVLLGIAFLDEAQYLASAPILIGFLLSLTGLLLLYRNRARLPAQSSLTDHFFLWVFLACVLFGAITFAMRYLAYISEMPATGFVAWLYLGSAVSAFVIRSLDGERSQLREIPRRQWFVLASLAALLVLSNLTAFWAFRTAPLSVATPVFQAAGVVCPSLLGLFVFKEIRSLTRLEWGGILCAFLGSMLIVTQYPG